MRCVLLQAAVVAGAAVAAVGDAVEVAVRCYHSVLGKS